MKVVKKIVSIAFAVFLAYQAYALISIFRDSSKQSFSILEGLILAFLLVLFITGFFAFLGFVLPTHRVLPASYYCIKKPELLRKLYRFFKVDIFRKALLIFFWGTQKNRKKYFDGTRQGIKNFIYQTKQSEFGHLGAFVITLIGSFYLFYVGFVFIGSIMCFMNSVGNAYPIVLQRYHRIRIGKLFDRTN